MRNRKTIILVFLPVIVIISLFYFYPLIETIRYSVTDSTTFIGLRRYTDFLSDPYFTKAFALSLKISVISTVVSIIFAVIVALAMRDTFVGKRICLFLYQTNISIPHVAIATMTVFMLGQTGIFSALSYNEGWISNWWDFPALINDTSIVGVVLSYSLKFIPFIGMAVIAVLQSFPRDFELQSRSLGVGKLKTFFHVTLPAIMPAIVTTSMIVFAFSFGCFEVPNILLGRQTLSTLIFNTYNDYYNPDGRNQAYAAAMIMAMITISISTIYLYITSNRKVKG